LTSNLRQLKLRVIFDDPTFCFANTEFFSVLLDDDHGKLVRRAHLQDA
jgi:hypothetical protein